LAAANANDDDVATPASRFACCASAIAVGVGVAVVTVKPMALLATPPTVTRTFPVVAPFGTGTTMPVADQLVGVATVPLNVTVLALLVAPKLLPEIVTAVPTTPLVGERPVRVGFAVVVTVYVSALLVTPPTVTSTLPVVALAGTGTTMRVEDQLVGVAVVPLNLTVFVPCVEPKLVPLMVTDVPTGPLVGERLVRVGVAEAVTVKVSALLATPPTVTTTPPVAALAGAGTTTRVEDQLVGVAVVPLNLTVLVPCAEPKLVPLMVTDVPSGPLVGERLVRVGVAGAVTVKVSALLATPPTVTTTPPVAALAGTGTTIPVADQLVGVAVVPLNLTVLVPCAAPKFVPAIVTEVPTVPLEGERLVTVGVTGAPPLAVRNATSCMIQPVELVRGAVALYAPADVTT
jgi:hypothetical protein